MPDTEPVILPGDHDTLDDKQKRSHYSQGCRHAVCVEAKRAYYRNYYRTHRGGLTKSAQARQAQQKALLAKQLVDATGTVRRVRGLIHAGWAPARLAEYVGLSESAIWYFVITPPEQILSSARDRLVRVYRTLRYTNPSSKRPELQRDVERAQQLARSLGWRGVFEWNDIDSDPEPKTSSEARSA
jgi:hypothetical protein